MKAAAALVLAVLLPVAAPASVIFGKDNDANRSDPGNGVPWRSVGRALSASGLSGTHNGCVVYLGNRFVLTAEHVQLSDSVSFDDVHKWQIDPSFRPVSLPDKVDLKIFRLLTEPDVPGVPLLPADEPDDFSPEHPVWHVGYGVGRAPGTPLDATEVPWAAPETCAKRWSMNVLRGREAHRDTDGGSDYAYEALFTLLGRPDANPPGLRENEGAITALDSGSGLFQQRAGRWYLVGIATDVARIGSNTSKFGSEHPDATEAGDKNFFVRVQTYQSELTRAMNRRQWPHIRLRYVAGSIALVITLFLGWLLRRRMARS